MENLTNLVEVLLRKPLKLSFASKSWESKIPQKLFIKNWFVSIIERVFLRNYRFDLFYDGQN